MASPGITEEPALRSPIRVDQRSFTSAALNSGSQAKEQKLTGPTQFTQGTGRRRLSGVLAVALLGAGLLASCGGDSSPASQDESGDKGPLVVAFAIAKSGPIAPYDTGSSDATMDQIDEINAAGGLDGHRIKVIQADTQSDKNVSTNVANELVQKGAHVLIASCDFDYASPAMIVGTGAGIPSISLCGSDTKLATKVLGPNTFTASPGLDAEAVIAADLAYDKGFRKMYLLQDESIEYSKNIGRYAEAAFKALGGEVVGKQTYQGGPNTNIKAQVDKLAADPKGADFIELASWNPGASTALRQIRAGGVELPIIGPVNIPGFTVQEIAGKISDVYTPSFGCFDPCQGSPWQSMTDWAESYTEKHGKIQLNPTDAGVWLADAIAAAYKESGYSTDGAKLGKTLETMPPIDTFTGKMRFATPKCHKPTGWNHALVEIQGGEQRYTGSAAAEEIPDIGDGNTCAGPVETFPPAKG